MRARLRKWLKFELYREAEPSQFFEQTETYILGELICKVRGRRIPLWVGGLLAGHPLQKGPRVRK